MSATTLDRLVKMANQMATELGHQQPGNAAAALYDHLWHFWDPRMKGKPPVGLPITHKCAPRALRRV